MRSLPFAVVAGALALSACDTRIADAEAKVAANMWASHTSEFRREVATDFGVCGEVNGKTDQDINVGFTAQWLMIREMID